MSRELERRPQGGERVDAPLRRNFVLRGELAVELLLPAAVAVEDVGDAVDLDRRLCV